MYKLQIKKVRDVYCNEYSDTLLGQFKKWIGKLRYPSLHIWMSVYAAR